MRCRDGHSRYNCRNNSQRATDELLANFFQDLVESKILYLPVYAREASTDFNTEFFSRSPNALEDLLPELGDFNNIVHVIDVPSTKDGALAKVIADPQTREAVCFLERNREPTTN